MGKEYVVQYAREKTIPRQMWDLNDYDINLALQTLWVDERDQNGNLYKPYTLNNHDVQRVIREEIQDDTPNIYTGYAFLKVIQITMRTTQEFLTALGFGKLFKIQVPLTAQEKKPRFSSVNLNKSVNRLFITGKYCAVRGGKSHYQIGVKDLYWGFDADLNKKFFQLN